MKKLLPVIAVALVGVMQLLPAQAAAVDVTATIEYTTVALGAGTDNPGIGSADCLPGDEGCQKAQLGRHHRCAYLLAPEQAQSGDRGVLGYLVELSGSETAFTLNPVTDADFDVTFYVDLGSCSGQRRAEGAANPTAYPEGVQSNFSSWGNGPESGAIPAPFACPTDDDEDKVCSTRFAIVTVFGANDATFTFQAS